MVGNPGAEGDVRHLAIHVFHLPVDLVARAALPHVARVDLVSHRAIHHAIHAAQLLVVHAVLHSVDPAVRLRGLVTPGAAPQ